MLAEEWMMKIMSVYNETFWALSKGKGMECEVVEGDCLTA